jgi:hypothetical protein
LEMTKLQQEGWGRGGWRGGRERVLLQQTLAERDRDRAASKPKKENKRTTLRNK